MINNEELKRATDDLRDIVDRYNRKFKYDEVDFRSIDINPDLRFVCNGDKKEVEVIKEYE